MKTLLLVDIQYDFIPGGALAVAGGDQIIPVVNSLIEEYDTVVATQDWHPEDHQSFASQHTDKNPFDVIELNGIDQVLWPDHCVQGTHGASFPKELNTRPIETIFRKGMDKKVDSYSAFYDNNRLKSTRLAEYLKAKGVEEIDVAGLAGDYCVYYTIQDALESGFKVNLIADAVKPIDPKNYQNILSELKQNPQFGIK